VELGCRSWSCICNLKIPVKLQFGHQPFPIPCTLHLFLFEMRT
jgi:hypothetical protein